MAVAWHKADWFMVMFHHTTSFGTMADVIDVGQGVLQNHPKSQIFDQDATQ